MSLDAERLRDVVERKIPGVVYATVGGDVARGLAAERSASEILVTGAMVLPLRDVIGLRPALETKQRHLSLPLGEVRLVFDDVRRHLDALARTANTELLEDLFSPLVVLGGPDHERLKAVARTFINTSCHHDYLERARESRRRLRSGRNAVARHLVEAGRCYLAGAHVLRTGRVEANVKRLLDDADEAWLKPFLRRHEERGEAAFVEAGEVALVERELDRLEQSLALARDESRLPDGVGSVTALDEFLVDLRLRGTIP